MTPAITAPAVDVGMLVRRPPDEVFEALADPSRSKSDCIHR